MIECIQCHNLFVTNYPDYDNCCQDCWDSLQLIPLEEDEDELTN